MAANGAEDFPRIQDKQAARQTLATSGTELTPERESDLRRRMAADDVIPLLLDRYAPLWLAGILGAGIMAAVMASDSQILALSTMFTEDIFAFYGGKQRFGDRAQVQTGRLFVALITSAAFVIALKTPATIFLVAVQYSFTGYAALLPLLVAALFWKRSTRWGALATTLWAGGSVGAIALLQAIIPPPSGPPTAILSWGGLDLIVKDGRRDHHSGLPAGRPHRPGLGAADGRGLLSDCSTRRRYHRALLPAQDRQSIVSIPALRRLSKNCRRRLRGCQGCQLMSRLFR